jgi:hypothetical protein
MELTEISQETAFKKGLGRAGRTELSLGAQAEAASWAIIGFLSEARNGCGPVLPPQAGLPFLAALLFSPALLCRFFPPQPEGLPYPPTTIH